MRQIKFRAWDKKQKSWILEKVFFCDGITYILRGNVMVELNKEDYEIVQFIGLYDKNGKEIYEGDIMTQQRNGITQHNRVVKYQIEQGAFFVLGNSVDKIDWDDCLTKDRIDTFEYEIIGNIYENPELLTPEA